MCVGFVNGSRRQSDAINGNAFHKESALVVRSACGQGQEFIQTLCDVCEFGFLVAVRFGNVLGLVEEDPSSQIRSVVGFQKPFVEVGLATSLGFIEGRVGVRK